MQTSDELKALLHRVEPVEWCYDGLGGKVIRWTHANGNDHEDPSILAFLVGVDGKVESSLMNGQQYQPGGFTKWLEAEVNGYEKAHPKTRLPFVLTDVKTSDDTFTCAALAEAHEAGTPALLFFGREREYADEKATKKEVKRTRSFAKKVLDSTTAEKQAEGFAFFRFDVSDPAHAGYAAQLGLEEFPTLLLWLPGAEAPQVLGRKVSPTGLAQAMKKAKTSEAPAK